jgi:carbohydrate kinase (thermoresistant glucokinase family)
MGPSGNGKSALGMALAQALGLPFIEGDDCHPPANIARMARGEPLTDADRAPFLDAVGRALAGHPGGAVAACSALRRQYRDQLRAVVPALVFVLPRVDRTELARRMTSRPGHFMPPALLDSQLATLELPQDDETAIIVDGGLPLPDLAQAVIGDLTRLPD